MLITKTEAAAIVGKTRQAVDKWLRKKPRPAYFVEVEPNRFKIDSTHPAWIIHRDLLLLKNPVTAPRNKKNSEAKKKKSQRQPPSGVPAKKGYQPITTGGPEHPPPINPSGSAPPIQDKATQELVRRATVADLEKTIFEADIKKEKLKQEMINTLEKQRGLAPMDLLKHYFSYIKRVTREIYRRPHEMGPQLSAYFLAGEVSKAEEYMVKQLEAVVKESTAALIEDLKADGYKYKKESE